MGYVEVGNGFVEQHDRGLLGESTCEHHTLQFAAAHLAGKRKAQVPGVGLFHTLFHDVPVGLRLVLEPALVGVSAHKNGLEGGELEIGLWLLPHEGKSLSQFARRIVVDVAVLDGHCAVGGFDEVGDAAEQGGLAASVGAHDGIETAFFDFKVDVVEYLFLAESA